MSAQKNEFKCSNTFCEVFLNSLGTSLFTKCCPLFFRLFNWTRTFLMPTLILEMFWKKQGSLTGKLLSNLYLGEVYLETSNLTCKQVIKIRSSCQRCGNGTLLVWNIENNQFHILYPRAVNKFWSSQQLLESRRQPKAQAP